MYASILDDLAHEYVHNSSLRGLLADVTPHPIHDALPLRFLGAIHRLVLTGAAPRLAEHYPSAGGTPSSGLFRELMRTVDSFSAEIRQALFEQVQTNEVARSVVPLVLLHWLNDIGISECDYFEIGASAGLNMLCDHYCARAGSRVFGQVGSSVDLGDNWATTEIPVGSTSCVIHSRRGVDIAPRDVTNSRDMVALESFLWPDQIARIERFRSAVALARVVRPQIDAESAESWVGHIAASHSERASIFFHSIVWQYLGSDVQHQLRDTLERMGRTQTHRAPLVWARMEPAGPVADLQVTVWKDSVRTDHRLATVGYHGQNFTWLEA